MATDAQRPAVEVVALLASAGGLDALTIVLRDLPAEFPAAVVVQQHLGGQTSVLPAILARRTQQRVDWAFDGQKLIPGQVIVCPPGVDMELMPDGSCCLRALEGIGMRRFDTLLASMAGSYGARSLAVVLSGSGCDGAEGTAAMKRAGAVVIAQSPNTAAYPSMPLAAAKAGAALVVPIDEIGRVLTEITDGGSLSRLCGELDSPRALFDGEIRAPLRETDRSSAGHSTLDSGNPMAALLAPSRRANSAAERAQVARQRVAELRRRRRDLAAGIGATEQTAATARLRAAESLRRAELAHQAASEHAAAIAD